jgi:hypothetical protein
VRDHLLLSVGAALVLPLALVDPAVALLLFDLELLGLLGSVGVAFLREDVRVLLHRVAISFPVLWFRAGVRLTRASPRSVLDA